MATRASIKFTDNQGSFIANVYHHYDGYPEYLGRVLTELTAAPIQNGLTLKRGPNGEPTRGVLGEVFNGMGCLVASVIAKLKDQPGSVYLYTEADWGECGEDYLYEVVENSEGTGVEVLVSGNNGDPLEFEWEFVSDVLEKATPEI
jgi:hypothetical protein